MRPAVGAMEPRILPRLPLSQLNAKAPSSNGLEFRRAWPQRELHVGSSERDRAALSGEHTCTRVRITSTKRLRLTRKQTRLRSRALAQAS